MVCPKATLASLIALCLPRPLGFRDLLRLPGCIARLKLLRDSAFDRVALLHSFFELFSLLIPAPLLQKVVILIYHNGAMKLSGGVRSTVQAMLKKGLRRDPMFASPGPRTH
jgi:hypothetical protein